MMKDQMVPQDQSASEGCLHCEINDLVQEHEGQEKVDLAALAANLEEAATWFYVVDCATCKAVIPFKHAPEDEPILRFPTMRVRCFRCHTDHTYAADLISHRKAAAPRGIFKRDRPPSHAGDGDREASGDRQEDRGVGDSEGEVSADGGKSWGVAALQEPVLSEAVILDREIAPLSSSLRCDRFLIGAVSGKRARIFFLSSCFFAAGWVSQLGLDIFYPVPLAALNELRSSGPAMPLGTAFFGTVLVGLVLFIIGIGTFFVEVCGFIINVEVDKANLSHVCASSWTGYVRRPSNKKPTGTCNNLRNPRRDLSDDVRRK
jgi:hypothetical protein